MAWDFGRRPGRSLNRTSERRLGGSGREGRSAYRRERPWRDEEGRIGTLLKFSVALVELDGRKFAIGPRDLEPLDSPDESPAGPGSGS